MTKATRLSILLLANLFVVALGRYDRAAVAVFADSTLETLIREQTDIPTGDILHILPFIGAHFPGS